MNTKYVNMCNKSGKMMYITLSAVTNYVHTCIHSYTLCMHDE